jgi:hypothetical protein
MAAAAAKFIKPWERLSPARHSPLNLLHSIDYCRDGEIEGIAILIVAAAGPLSRLQVWLRTLGARNEYASRASPRRQYPAGTHEIVFSIE